MEILSLIFLAITIFIGAKFNKNSGLIGIIFAYLLGTFGLGLKAKEILSGWPMNVFFTTVAVNLLFGVANANGTTEKISKNIVYFAKGNNKLLPIIFCIGGAVIAGIGGGAPICGMILPLALTVGSKNKVPILIMSLLSMFGIMIGGMSPLALNGIVASNLAIEQGVMNYTPIFIKYGITMAVVAIAAYLILGGLKIESGDNKDEYKPESFDMKQIITLFVILGVIIGVIVFKLDIAFLAISCGALLLLFNFAEQKNVISNLPWNIIMLIGGMGILINIVTASGGIDYLSSVLSNYMTERTAGSIIVILGGMLGSVSSGTGVAMPTLIPVAARVAGELGLSASYMVSSVIIGINAIMCSPLSTVGGICVASAPETEDKAKLFNQLLLSSVIVMLFIALVALLGLYK